MPCSFFIKRGQIKLKIAHVGKIRTQKIQDENTRILLVKTEMSLIKLIKNSNDRSNGEIYMPVTVQRCNSATGKNKLMEEKNMEMRHGAIYTCKTLRMLGYLKQKGFMPFVTEPDANNGRYNVFKFYNSVELEEAIEEYFEQIKNK